MDLIGNHTSSIYGENSSEVIFHFSIDSYGDINHFIRWPISMEKSNDNYELDNYPFGNLRLTTATTVTILSLYYLPDFIGWKVNQDWKLLNKFPCRRV